MEGSVFVFTRDVTGTKGQPLRQAIKIYALNLASARTILEQELRDVQKFSTAPEPDYGPNPGWRVFEVPLTEERVITSALT